jgi:NAD(P)H dehydrogenase (quinone)
VTAVEPASHVLVVYCHPTRTSFCGSVLARLTQGLVAAGHSFEVADLHAEDFEPVFLASDYTQFEGGTLPARILDEQARVDRCDALAFVAPIWWLGLPAMLKGWFDRVWSNGWAYEFENDPEGSLLRPRPFAFVFTAGGSQGSWARHGYDAALDTILRHGILGWCGVAESTVAILHDAGFAGDEATRVQLDYVAGLGRSVFAGTAPPAVPAGVTLLG